MNFPLERHLACGPLAKPLKLLRAIFDNRVKKAVNSFESRHQALQGFGDCLSLRAAAGFSGGPIAS
jgi:hypothetical protein